MSRSRKRTEALSRIARIEQTDAARRLAASAAEHAAKAEAAEQLKRYVAEYRDGAERRGELDAERWSNERLFVERLQSAAAMRDRDAQAALEKYREDAERWRGARGRCEALDRIAERLRRDEARAADKREQTEIDERAARRDD